jgi:hypothetical protein
VYAFLQFQCQHPVLTNLAAARDALSHGAIPGGLRLFSLPIVPANRRFARQSGASCHEPTFIPGLPRGQ